MQGRCQPALFTGRTEKGNLFYSPAGIHAALAMTYAGARVQTAEQMAKAMHYPGGAEGLARAYGAILKNLNTPRVDWEKKPAYELVVSNALWGRKGYPFLEPFLALNRKHYGAGLNQVDFGYYEDATVQVLEMPYRQRELGMLVILPRKNGGLPAVEKVLNPRTLKKWFALKNCKVNVTFPKFRIEGRFSLPGQLKALGMTAAFNPGTADFSGVARREKLYIAEVINKAFVEVDEKGTEAAAATAVMMEAGGVPPPEEPGEFKADHPFLFLIRHHRTREVLFVGRVMDPKGK